MFIDDQSQPLRTCACADPAIIVDRVIASVATTSGRRCARGAHSEPGTRRRLTPHPEPEQINDHSIVLSIIVPTLNKITDQPNWRYNRLVPRLVSIVPTVTSYIKSRGCIHI